MQEKSSYGDRAPTPLSLSDHEESPFVPKSWKDVEKQGDYDYRRASNTASTASVGPGTGTNPNSAVASPPTANEALATPLEKVRTFTIHPAVYVGAWIFASGSVILFNKYIFTTANFPFPVFLTTMHLIFATIATRLMHYTGSLKKLDNTSLEIPFATWYRAVLPVGVLFCASLVTSNSAYLTLSVAFIQMLKAMMPGAVLLCGYIIGVEKPSAQTVGTVSIIVFGTMVAAYGEIRFVLSGFTYQILGIAFEAFRLVMIQKLLKSYKMGPLVSLYHFAPICAILNVFVLIFYEGLDSFLEIQNVGALTLMINCAMAFLLNIAVVMLIGKTSGLVLTLAGILKDILLIACSLIMFGGSVSFIQAFGYSIALAGLFVYKMGVTQTKEFLVTISDRFSDRRGREKQESL